MSAQQRKSHLELKGTVLFLNLYLIEVSNCYTESQILPQRLLGWGRQYPSLLPDLAQLPPTLFPYSFQHFPKSRAWFVPSRSRSARCYRRLLARKQDLAFFPALPRRLASIPPPPPHFELQITHQCPQTSPRGKLGQFLFRSDCFSRSDQQPLSLLV